MKQTSGNMLLCVLSCALNKVHHSAKCMTRLAFVDESKVDLLVCVKTVLNSHDFLELSGHLQVNFKNYNPVKHSVILCNPLYTIKPIPHQVFQHTLKYS